jgi:hypothetical protein
METPRDGDGAASRGAPWPRPQPAIPVTGPEAITTIWVAGSRYPAGGAAVPHAHRVGSEWRALLIATKDGVIWRAVGSVALSGPGLYWFRSPVGKYAWVRVEVAGNDPEGTHYSARVTFLPSSADPREKRP